MSVKHNLMHIPLHRALISPPLHIQSSPCHSIWQRSILFQTFTPAHTTLRPFTRSARRLSDDDPSKSRRNIDPGVTEEELHEYDRRVADNKMAQMRRPWMREGSDLPPVREQRRSASAMTKGKLLTTPSRLLKLILPLTTRDVNTDRKDAEPLALLIHPQQPLSYLERLIQAELPTVKDPKNEAEKIPDVHFRALDIADENGSETENGKKKAPDIDEERLRQRGGPGEGGVEVYSGSGREGEAESEIPAGPMVRWSKSTEIGDFIRDAARGREFAVEIEGAPAEIRVGVPSFSDRTYYLRMRLRRKAQQIKQMADIKRECDRLARNQAHWIAYAGFGGLFSWAVIVGYLTFLTDLGWDFMEPVTYIVSILGLLGGYGWFLSNRREVSYASAMNITVSRRQQKLYEERGFDMNRWQGLIDDGNAIRREILHIASEYDVDWSEKMDTKDEGVVKALRNDRKKRRKEENEDDGEEDEEAEASEKKDSKEKEDK